MTNKSRTANAKSRKQNSKRLRKQTTPYGVPVSLPTRQVVVKMAGLQPRLGGLMRYKGTDFVMNITSVLNSPDFTNLDIAMVKRTFPRLATIADAFQKYTFHNLSFEFIGKSSSTTHGAITIGNTLSDGFGGGILLTTSDQYKSLDNALTLKGWESGRIVFPVNHSSLRWHSVDTDVNTELIGAIYGKLNAAIDETAQPDKTLTWDIYAHYDVEFYGSANPGSVD